MRSDQKPNILFFFTDQQRWDTCGCYGQKLPVTPHLDRMAQDGVLFENAYTCQPVCGPTRACLQTGKYATRTGCVTNHIMLPQDEKTIANWLTEAGYEVGYIGKWHLASFGPKGGPDDFRERPVPLERRGGYKDYWLASDTLESTSHSYDGHMFDADGKTCNFPEGRYRADALGDWALEYLDSRSLKQPFFLFLSFIEPHHQNDHNCYEGPHGSKEKWKNYQVPGDLEATDGDWRENYPDYLGCCNRLDENLGRIRAKLEEMGIAENTLLVFTSDHGSHFRTRNPEYKRACHDGCTHVPLVIHGPGFTGGTRRDELVSLIDLPATLLTAAGLKAPTCMNGSPLQGLLDGTAQNWQDDVFIQISEDHNGRAVRTRKWTYEIEAIVPPESNSGDAEFAIDTAEYREAHLYDNENDPFQRTNLVLDPAFAAIRDELRKRLLRRMAEAQEKIPVIRSVYTQSA